MFCMHVNGQRVVVAEALNGQYRLNIQGSHWGYFQCPEVAIRAAIAVLTAPRYH